MKIYADENFRVEESYRKRSIKHVSSMADRDSSAPGAPDFDVIALRKPFTNLRTRSVTLLVHSSVAIYGEFLHNFTLGLLNALQAHSCLNALKYSDSTYNKIIAIPVEYISIFFKRSGIIQIFCLIFVTW
jgi:hypothetical protein